MSRDLFAWLLFAALIMVAMGLFIADQVHKANQRNALLDQGTCEESAMVEAVRSYKKVVFGLAVLATILRDFKGDVALGTLALVPAHSLLGPETINRHRQLSRWP